MSLSVAAAKKQIEGIIAEAEADADAGPEVDAFLDWVAAFAKLRLAERELEDVGLEYGVEDEADR